MKEGMELVSELLEYAPHVWQAIGLLTIAALTAKQRKAILRRDNHQSQLRYYDEERGWHNDIDHCEDEGKDCPHLQAHHVKPQRSGGDDSPNNTITLGEVFSQRNQAVSEGVIYWNNEHDEEMLDTARQRSINPEWWIKI